MSDQQQLDLEGNAQGKQPPESGESGDLHTHGPLRREFDGNFLQYASYVIRDRAIPDLDDGLKPVQRRILHSLHENDDGKFIKVANIVGHTMQYHPHGDASIGEALVALCNKDYLIEGQGNFGNIHTGDPAAAARYIECRLTDLARDEIFNEQLTRYVPTYDGRKKEPVLLPAKVPLLLMLGAEGIAVGLSTRILPHNFRELLEAQIAVLKKQPFEIFPDFRQGGLMDPSEYEKGHGRVKLRAVVERKDSRTLVIREIPCGTTTDSVMASIEDAARKKKISIKSIHDFTSENVEIEIQLAEEKNADRTLQALYAFTQCEVTISSRMVVIHKNRPKEMDVEEVLRHNTGRLVHILKRELQCEKTRLLDELHHRTLVQIFVGHRIYKDIEECTSYPNVKRAVLDGVNRYRSQLKRDVTQQDVDMLLSIKIKRISRFDMEKSRKDIDDIAASLRRVEKHLADVVAYAVRYLKDLLRKHGEAHARRTRIQPFDAIAVRELTARELTICHDKEKGYLGHAVKGDALLECSSHDRIIIVRRDGRYKVVAPPDKLFVGDDLLYSAVADKARMMTMVYSEDEVTYMKRFCFGGAILNKDYSCTPGPSSILLFTDDAPKEIFVKYKKEKRLRILQQVFDVSNIPIKGVKARGAQMTVKKIRSISTTKPRNWRARAATPRGVLLDF